MLLWPLKLIFTFHLCYVSKSNAAASFETFRGLLWAQVLTSADLVFYPTDLLCCWMSMYSAWLSVFCQQHSNHLWGKNVGKYIEGLELQIWLEQYLYSDCKWDCICPFIWGILSVTYGNVGSLYDMDNWNSLAAFMIYTAESTPQKMAGQSSQGILFIDHVLEVLRIPKSMQVKIN